MEVSWSLEWPQRLRGRPETGRPVGTEHSQFVRKDAETPERRSVPVLVLLLTST